MPIDTIGTPPDVLPDANATDFPLPAADVDVRTDDSSLADWQVMLAIAALCWMSRYWLASKFGLYEDDYLRIPDALASSLKQAPAALWQQILIFQQGRPLHAGLIGLFSTIGNQFHHGLLGLYWIGYSLSVLNAFLLYKLLRKVQAGQAISAAAAAAFAVYPADVSQAFLTHALGVQPALMLVLIATHLWLKGLRVESWVIVFLAVFSYETPVPLFAAAPLLLPQWNGRQALRHATAVMLGIGVIGVLRKHFGEERSANLSLFHTAGVELHNLSMGPLVSLSSYIWRPFEMANGFDRTAVVLGLLAACIGFLLLLRCGTPAWDRLPRLAGAGAACLLLSYTLPVILDAAERDGRATRVHYAGSVGCAILLACMFSFQLRRYGRVVTASIMAVLLGASTAAGVAVQRDYQLSWNLQRAFWADVVRLCPDIAPGKVVLLENYRGLPEAQHLKVFEWQTALVLPEAYHFPDGGPPAPRLFVTTADWRNYLDAKGGLILNKDTAVWPFTWEAPYRYEQSDRIILNVVDGHLVREGISGAPTNIPQGVLYKYLLGPATP